MTTPTYSIYGGKAYRPCGCCDVCTDPALSYSDCGQPVLVETESQVVAKSVDSPASLTLLEQVAELENKSKQFDIAREKIMELQTYIDDPDPAGRALPAAVQRLIDFYRT